MDPPADQGEPGRRGVRQVPDTRCPWRRGCRWRSPTRVRDGAGSLGKSPRFGRLTRSESGLSVYRMETPPTRDSQRRKPSGALPQGLADSLKVRKPAHAMLNIAAGEGMLRPPSNPRPVAPLAEQRTRGGEAPEPRFRCAHG